MTPKDIYGILSDINDTLKLKLPIYPMNITGSQFCVLNSQAQLHSACRILSQHAQIYFLDTLCESFCVGF